MKARQLAALIASVMIFSACDETNLFAPDDQARFAIVMESEGTTGTSTFSVSLMGPEGPMSAVVSLDQVESIFLPLGDVETQGARAGAPGWIDAGAVNQTVDLLNLPDGGITLLDSTLPEGDYSMLRFHLTDEATIVLTEEVTVGNAVFEAGEHPLVIPGSAQAGLRLFVDFVVDDDGEELTILVDGRETVRSVIATGAGTLRIAPVLRILNQNGQNVGGDVDDDDEA